MSYRSVNFRDEVLYPIAGLLNNDVARGDLLKEHVQPWIRSINRHLPKAYKFWTWPELTITEERAFATIWNANKTFVRQNSIGQPSELFYLINRKYYRVKVTAISDPIAGTLPTNTTYFEEFTPSSWVIGYRQGCRQAIGEVISIYGTNPRINNGRGVPSLDFSPISIGIEVAPAGFDATVFVNYRIRAPKFSYEPYDATKIYAPGDVIYWDSKINPGFDGECYRAITAVATNQAPTTIYWARVLFPEFVAEYVINATAAEAAEDEQNKVDFFTIAKAALQQETDARLAQGQRFSYGRSCRCGPRYVSWGDSGAVSTLTDQCDNEWGDMVTVAVSPLLTAGVQEMTLTDISELAAVDMGPWEFGQLFAITINDSTQLRQYQSGAPTGTDMAVLNNVSARLRQTGGY